MSKRFEPTEEQKSAAKAKRQALTNLTQLAKEMDESDMIAQIGPVGFHRIDGRGLSYRNQWLLTVQGCPFGRVAGIHDWPKVGRRVSKDTHGYMIWVPLGMGKLPDDPQEDASGTPTGFRVGYLFAENQTEPVVAKVSKQDPSLIETVKAMDLRLQLA